MKKILFFFILSFFFQLSFAQTFSESDSKAVISLYKKLRLIDDKYNYPDIILLPGIEMEVINDEYRVTKILLSNKFENGHSGVPSDPIVQNLEVDLTAELSALTEIEEIDLLPGYFYLQNLNRTEYIHNFTVDLNLLSHLKKIKTFKVSFENGASFNKNALLIVKNVDLINNFSLLTNVCLGSLKEFTPNKVEFQNLTDLKIQSSLLDFNFFKEVKSNKTENLEIDLIGDSTSNINFQNNYPSLKSLVLKGEFLEVNNTIYTPQLIKLRIESEKGINSLNNIHLALNLSSLDVSRFDTSKLILSENLKALQNLTSLSMFSQGYINNLQLIHELKNLKILNLNLSTNYSSGLDFINFKNLTSLSYTINENDRNIDYNSYVLPLNLDKLTKLQSLQLSIGDISNIKFENFIDLKKITIRYINPNKFAKIDISNNTNLGSIEFYGFGVSYLGYEDLFIPIEFETNYFKKLTELESLVFGYIPVKLDVTNMFINNNKLRNFQIINTPSVEKKYKSEFKGVLNLCNNNNIYLQIRDNLPFEIDFRNNQRTRFIDIYNSLSSPKIIVDNIDDFIKTHGDSYKNLTGEYVKYNLTTSTEPCERTLSTNNLNKSVVKIHPNPVVDVLNVETDANKNSIKIIDLTGKIIDSYSINDKKTSINVNHLPKGIYIVEIENEKGKTISKFIKK